VAAVKVVASTARVPVLVVAAVKVVASTAFSNRYGWFQDELYYRASAYHLELGYVDFPPVTPLIARLALTIAPDSLIALRFTSIVAGAVVAILAALIARELGGGRLAQVVATAAVVISPVFIVGNFEFGTVSFDQLAWALLLWLLVRLLGGHSPRLWLVAGAVLGIGLETKYTIAALAVALTGGLLLTRARRHLATPWPWLGFALALLLFLPNLWWQVGHDWISVTYTFQHRGNTDGPLAYWLEQLLIVQPLLLPLVVAGAVWLWRSGTYRTLTWLAILVELLSLVAGGKSYYPAAMYPLLYAAGAVWVEQCFRSRVFRAVWLTLTLIVTLVLLPIELPVEPAALFASSGEWRSQPDFAGMYGWPQLSQQIALVYRSLPPSERRGTMVLASNYSEAGALDLYGPNQGLPASAVVSPHLTYYYWAPARMNPQVVIAVGYDRQQMRSLFGSVTRVGTVHSVEGVQTGEGGGPIYICRSPRQPLWQAWPSLQSLD
jgi:Dolichyl-phosphate-mannose-protein mannosyltransferase